MKSSETERIKISRPEFKDKEMIYRFFEIVIRDTFEKNGISELADSIAEEIEVKRNYLNQDFSSDGAERFFFIAKDNDKIVGSAEFGQANETINKCTEGKLSYLAEVGTVFVHPEYQKKGLGSRLLNAVYNQLEKIGVKEFCLDSGYETAQKIWSRKFGKPDYIIKDYWTENADHMIWKINLTDVLNNKD